MGLNTMTLPLPVTQGTPDFLPQLASANIQILRKSESISALKTYPIVYVGNIPYMYIRISAAAAMNLGIAFFADAAGTQSLFGDVVTTSTTASDAMVCVPVRGPYVKFTVERGVYPGTINFDAFSVPSRFNVYAGTDGENTLIDVHPQAIAAGATVDINAITVRSGRIYFRAVLEASASARIQLFAVDFLGVEHMLDYSNQDMSSTGRLLYAPALPLRLRVFNNGAVLNLYATVTHHPFDF